MPKILYVEDHPPAQMLMEAIIADLTAHELLLAGTGASAEQITRETPPDLYILDMDLPDTDGIKLAKQLTSINSAPVILVSAYAEAITDDTLSGLTCYYIPKPLDPTHVAETVQRALA